MKLFSDIRKNFALIHKEHLVNVYEEDFRYLREMYIADIPKLLEAVDEMQKALEFFYATFSPRFHPEGAYEIHIAPGEGGEVRFGTKAKKALEKIKEMEK